MPSEAQNKAQVDSSKSFPLIGLLSMILPHRCHVTTADQRPRASITVLRQLANVCFEITDMVTVANLAQAGR
jgi:hypothetical protein